MYVGYIFSTNIIRTQKGNFSFPKYKFLSYLFQHNENCKKNTKGNSFNRRTQCEIYCRIQTHFPVNIKPSDNELEIGIKGTINLKIGNGRKFEEIFVLNTRT